MNIPSSRIADNACFDDPVIRATLRLQEILRQDVPLLEGGGREILWWCQNCLLYWYQQGRDLLPGLSQQELTILAKRLHADVGPGVPCVPQLVCSTCSIDLYHGVAVLMEQIEAGGYRLAWYDSEAKDLLFCALASPSPQHAFSEQVEAMLRSRGDPPSHLGPLEHHLTRLSHLPRVKRSQVFPLSEDLCQHLSRLLLTPPACEWSGYSWRIPGSLHSPALLIVMALTGQREAPELLRSCWCKIAPIIQELLL